MDAAARQRVNRSVGLVLGLALLVLAIVFAAGGVDWNTIRDAAAGDLALLAAGVLGNVVLTGLLFWIITRSFDADPPVRPGAMIGLIALSGLLNYVPVVRPGLWGRAAYLKLRHNLPIRQSIVVLGIVLFLAALVLGATAAVLLLFTEQEQLWVGLLSLVVFTGLTGPFARRALRQRIVMPWLWAPLRTADMLVAAARLWLAFTIIGQPIGFADALLAAAAALVVRIIGLTPNGLGLSEWVIAALVSAATPISVAASAAAALIDRAVEVLVMIPTGLLAAWRLGRGP